MGDRVPRSEVEVGFSLNKQSAIGVAVADGNMVERLPYRGNIQPVLKEVAVDDAQHGGKGHDQPTRRNRIKTWYEWPDLVYDLTHLSALQIPAFVFGSNTPTQPDVTGSPSVWQHDMAYIDKAATPEVDYTSLLYKAGAAFDEKYSGCVHGGFTLQGNLNDHVTIALNQLISRTKATFAGTNPSLATGQSFYKTLKSSFDFGAQAGAVGIEADVRSWNLSFSQNAKPFWYPNLTSGTEHLIAQVLRGRQTVQGQITVFLDSTIRDLLQNHTLSELTLVLGSGTNIENAYDYQVTISIPALYMTDEGSGVDEELQTYTFNIFAIQEAGANVVDYQVQTDEDNTKILIAA